MEAYRDDLKTFFGHVYSYIISINAVVFLVMVLSGVSFIEPTVKDLLAWGASFKPNVLEGEWWRLFSSMFLHIGIFHLLFNMYALYAVSVFLEPMLGKLLYLTAYLCTGIFGGLLSLGWHTENLVVAGASGAIFGLYGVFFALLTTKLIPTEIRNNLLISIGIFVAYNLIYGLQAGIDNASHMGGLLSGLVIGYLYYFTLGREAVLSKWIASIAVIIATAASLGLYLGSSADTAAFYKAYNEFATLEEKALAPYKSVEGKTAIQFKAEIQQTVRPALEKALQVLKETEKLKLPDNLTKLRDNLLKYLNLRLEEADILSKAQDAPSGTYTEQIKTIGAQIQQLIKELTGKEIPK